MYTHTIYNGLLLRNVRVEIVHETNPVFANEEVSAIVRFRHLGVPIPKKEAEVPPLNNDDIDPTDTGEDNIENNENTDGTDANNDDGAGWFGKRLSLQLTNTARSLFLEQLENTEQEEKIDPKNLPVDLISGYIQLSGFFTYDGDVIEHEKVDSFRKRSAVSGKIGGLEGLEVSKIEGNGIMKLIGGMSTLFNATNGDLKIDDNRDNVNTDNLVPFFSTSQSLLFSEIHLEAGEVKTFYFKCKLPKELPPSYTGNSIKINYHTVIGAALDEKFPKPLNVHFPLRVSSFFDKNGYQPISNLERFILLPSNMIFNELVTKSSERRRSSFRTIKNVVLTKPELSHTEKQEKFLERLDKLIDQDEDDLIIEEFITPKVKDVITTFCEVSLTHQETNPDESKFIIIDDFKYEKQLTKFQTQYLISKSKQTISTLTFSKPFYKIGEQIRISLDFQNSDINTTGVLISLENLELIKDSYSASPQETKTHPRSVTHFKESYSTFNLRNLSVSLPIPLNATSQFKTNIFESRWSISVKFIISTDEYLHKVHEDSIGEFSFAKDHVSGEEFKIRLPVTVLPSDQDFGGIPV